MCLQDDRFDGYDIERHINRKKRPVTISNLLLNLFQINKTVIIGFLYFNNFFFFLSKEFFFAELLLGPPGWWGWRSCVSVPPDRMCLATSISSIGFEWMGSTHARSLLHHGHMVRRNKGHVNSVLMIGGGPSHQAPTIYLVYRWQMSIVGKTLWKGCQNRAL